ncbi:MAG: HlyD family efflux transporter periplasmic adaptor subunit [Cyanobacteria bacterium P01_F01_bin.86]
MKQQRIRTTVMSGIGLLAIVMAVSLSYVRKLSRSESETVTTEAILEVSENEPIAALGRLEPQGKVINIAANPTAAGSRINEIFIQEGDQIEAGQIIATLDNNAQQLAALAEAKRDVEIAQAKFAQVKAGAKTGEIEAQKATIARLKAKNVGEINAQQARIARLEAELSNAEEELGRSQSLLQAGAISASALDNQRTIAETYRQEVSEAQNILNQILTAGQEEIREAEANLDRIAEIRPVDLQLAQAEINGVIAAVERAEAELALTQVRSPIDGQILQVHVQPGEIVGEAGVATLGQTGQMYVIAEVHETDINRVKIDQKAQIFSEYGGFDGRLKGLVEQVGLQIHRNSLYDPNPGTQSDARVVEVRIRLEPDDSERVQALTNLQVRAIINP